VIVLSGRVDEADRVRGFVRGADDYLPKPFSYSELLGRIRAVLRRASGRPLRGVLRVGELTVDPVTRAVRLAGERVDLSAKEFASCTLSPATPHGSISRTTSCGMSGDTPRSGPPGPWTPTPAACARSSRGEGGPT